MFETSEMVLKEEMWRTIEEFGIDRKRLESLNPSLLTLSELYLSIVKAEKDKDQLRS